MTTLPDKQYINPLLLITGIMCAASGLLLQIAFHMGHGDRGLRQMTWGLSHYAWASVHKFASLLFFLVVLLHLMRNGRWIERLITQRKFARNKQVIALSGTFALAAALGFFAWGISVLQHPRGVRHLFIEIHDKVTLLLTILTAWHVWGRRKRVFTRRMRQVRRKR